MNLHRIIKEEVNDFEDLNWIDKISDKWDPKVGDKFICKPGFDTSPSSYYYGGAAYIPNKVYTIQSILKSRFGDSDGKSVLYTVEDEFNNGVYKKAAEPYFEYLEESTDDFDWVRGDVNFDINEIFGKQMYYRENNLGQLETEYNASIFDFNRGDVTLGDIRRGISNGWRITEITDKTCILTMDRGDEMPYQVDEVEQYVNLGVWVLLDERGNVLNDFENKNITESEYYLNKVISKLSLLTEDGKTKPDMEWDFTNIKKDLDKSKQWVKTAEDVKNYLALLFQKVKNLPKKTKIKIIKYVLFSFVGLIGLKELNSVAKEVSPEKIEIKLKKAEEEIKIRKSSDQLLNHLKQEEGIGGKPVLTTYDLGDGAYTIGYGHAVFADPSRGDNGGKYDFLPTYDQIEPGKTKITPKQAEILLRDDMKVAEDGLNRILNDWEKEGIKPNINQNMYDAMISMIYNMGVGNFRMSDFIQMVKRGDTKSAAQEIKNVSSNMFSKYPGLKTRRERESKLFTSQS